MMTILGILATNSITALSIKSTCIWSVHSQLHVCSFLPTQCYEHADNNLCIYTSTLILELLYRGGVVRPNYSLRYTPFHHPSPLWSDWCDVSIIFFMYLVALLFLLQFILICWFRSAIFFFRPSTNLFSYKYHPVLDKMTVSKSVNKKFATLGIYRQYNKRERRYMLAVFGVLVVLYGVVKMHWVDRSYCGNYLLLWTTTYISRYKDTARLKPFKTLNMLHMLF